MTGGRLPDQMRIYHFDDLCKDSLGLMRDMYTFLGVHANFTPDVTVDHNPGRVVAFPWLRSPYNKTVRYISGLIPQLLRRRLSQWLGGLPARIPPRIDPALRAALTAEFRSDILATQDLIGRELTHWL
jgi:hypothetical protein